MEVRRMTRHGEPSAAQAKRLSSFITSLQWDDVPDDVRHKTSLAALDDLAAVLSGAPARSSRIAADYAAATFAAGATTLVADARRTAAEGSAFANAVAANAYDIDDVGVHVWGHAGAQVFPTALALAEEIGASGQDLLTAMLVGYEIAALTGIGMYADVPVSPDRDYRGCGAWGAVACAAVAARLSGLGESETCHALGIAEYHAPHVELLQDVRHPAMVKHGHGPAALTGVMSARLAARGFTGIPSLLELERLADRVDDLGVSYLIMGRGLEWKRYACCWWVHPALDAVAAIIATTPFTADEVSRIAVEAHHDSRLLGARSSVTTEEAQFNMAWPIAALIVDGDVSPAQVAEDRMTDEGIRDLAARVELLESAELDRLFWLAETGSPQGREGARVLIELKDGRVLDSGIVSLARGDESSWTTERMRDKFHWATRRVLTQPASEEICGLAESLPALDDVRVLTAALRRHLFEPPHTRPRRSD
jgi:2-methylcitrate dehydratase PrpD